MRDYESFSDSDPLARHVERIEIHPSGWKIGHRFRLAWTKLRSVRQFEAAFGKSPL